MSAPQETPPSQQSLLSRPKLYEIVNSIAYGERIDPSVEYALLKIAEAFILDLAASSAELARHRHSHTIEPKDIQLYLEREWDMGLAGFVDDEEKTTVKVAHPTIAHQTRSTQAARAASTSMGPSAHR